MQEAMQKAAVLIEAMPYLQRFAGKEIVIKFGGSVMDSPGVIDDIVEDIVFLATVGIKPVVVHGGGNSISRAMDEGGLKPKFVDGHRVTDDAALRIVVDTLLKVNAGLVENAAKHGGRAASAFQSGRSCMMVRKKKFAGRCEDAKAGSEHDLGHVGEVVSVDCGLLRTLEHSGEVLFVPPIGQDGSGQLYNINADSAASAIASSLSAEKIVFLSDVHGIMRDPDNKNSFLSSIGRDEAFELMSDGIISGGMLPKVKGCLNAIGSGVRKAHIIDGSLNHSLLLEIFTDSGVGTQILAE